MKYTDLSCIRCGKDGPPSWSEEGPPAGSLIFISYGNYGSTVFDPPGGGDEYLVVLLCDECAVAQAGAQNVMHIRKPRPAPPPKPNYRGPWRPDAVAAIEEDLREMRKP